MAASAAATLAATVQRADLIRDLKTTGKNDVSTWVSLVRHDLIMAAASDNVDAWKQVARLADQALLGSRELWKSNPVQYITITLDQARAYLWVDVVCVCRSCVCRYSHAVVPFFSWSRRRCGTLADAKRTLGSLRSVGAVKQCWSFWQLLVIIEARQGESMDQRSSRLHTIWC
jgi:hypothetical protein